MQNNHHSVEIAYFSRYRGPLMGFAMLFVMLFHCSGLPIGTLGYAIHRIGNVGVDMFLFLSGIGLWYSWDKTPSLHHFYVRRLLRIYPVWLGVAGYFYINSYIHHTGFTHGLGDTIANILVGWSFWQRDAWEFWFIPSILMMYVFAPYYMRLIRRQPAYRFLPFAFILLSILIEYVPVLNHAVGHIEIFWSRIPIFLIGINCGSLAKHQHALPPSTWPLVILIFIMSAASCITLEDGLRGQFPLFLERMVYIPLSITAMLLLSRLLAASHQWIINTFAFIGGISLELYLVHIHYVLNFLTPLHLGYALTAAIMIAVSILMAWPLHLAAKWIMNLNK